MLPFAYPPDDPLQRSAISQLGSAGRGVSAPFLADAREGRIDRLGQRDDTFHALALLQGFEHTVGEEQPLRDNFGNTLSAEPRHKRFADKALWFRGTTSLPVASRLTTIQNRMCVQTAIALPPELDSQIGG